MDNSNLPSLPNNELERLNALRSWEILDSASSKELDAFTKLAAEICETPFALLSLIDENRQWFMSKVNLDITEAPRSTSFCQYTVLGKEIFEVEDARENPLFANNPFVLGEPHIRFYAAAPLVDPNGFSIGSLCVVDQKPSKLNDLQRTALKNLANAIMTNIVLIKKTKLLEGTLSDLDSFFKLSLDFMCIASLEGYFIRISNSFTSNLGYTETELLEKPFISFVHEEDVEKTINALKDLNRGSTNILLDRKSVV